MGSGPGSPFALEDKTPWILLKSGKILTEKLQAW